MSLPEIDTLLFLFVNRDLQNSFLDIFMPFITNDAVLIFLPLVLWTILKDRKKALLFLTVPLIAVLLADGSGHILKDIFERQRPCNTLENINLLVSCKDSFSMPSNHAFNSFAFAMVFWILKRDSLSYLFILFAAIVGFSRVYVGVHYPSDVIVGSLLGIFTSYVSILLYRWAIKIYESKSYWQALCLLIFLISFFRVYFVVTGPFDLSPDEAHYWEWSRHLDWSYYSKGPLIAYIIYAGTAIFGNNIFGVRIFAIVLSALSSIVFYRMGSELYDDKTGFASALLIQIVPLYSAYGVIMTIDSPFMFFWILSLFLFYKALSRELSAEAGRSFNLYWVVLGFSIGLGMLAKYSMVFFYLSGFLFLVFYKDARRLLTAKGPYIATIISMIIFSPVIAWNAANGWITLKHTAGQAHLSDGFRISALSFFEFLGSQIGVVTPVLIVLVFIALWKLRKSKEGAFLFWLSVPVVAFFILKSIQGKVQANWALPGYATGFIAFSVYYIKDIEISKKAIKVLVASGILLAFVVTVVAHYPMVLNLPQERDPTIRLVGWKELGKEVSKIHNEMSSNGPVFIFSDKYQVSSELAFYIEGQPVTYCVNLGSRMNQYNLWPGFENLIGYNAIFVRTKDKNMPGELAERFGRYEKKVITVRTDHDKIMKFTVFKCYAFKGIEIRPLESF